MHEEPLKMLAVNQSTTALFRSLAEAFSNAGVKVKVLAGYLEHGGKPALPFTHLRAVRLRRAPAWRRIWTWSAFSLQAFWTMARCRDHFALLTTNPPLVPWLAPAAKRLFGLRYALLVYDIYPTALVRVGMVREGGWIHRQLLRLSRRSWRDADAVITLGSRMRDVILSQMPPGESLEVVVIPSWEDTSFIRPLPKADNPFARQHGLTDKLVVMYSGTFGLTHDCETLIDAAERLQDLPHVRFVLIGEGTRARAVRAYAAGKALSNLLILPRQPLDQIRYSLTSADIHVVSLDGTFAGISVPSKTYTALAAGAAVLYLGERQCEVADLIAEHACGLRIEPRDAVALAEAVRRLSDHRDGLETMRVNARKAAVSRFGADTILPQYTRLLMPLLTTRCRPGGGTPSSPLAPASPGGARS
jgi:glycosyltransferase involved in cell wall biosynthesis